MDLLKDAFPKEASRFWSDMAKLAGGYHLWVNTDLANFIINMQES
jgi:hypothetical protein